MQDSQGAGGSGEPSASSGVARPVGSPSRVQHLSSTTTTAIMPSSTDFAASPAPNQSPSTKFKVQTVLDEGWERFARTATTGDLPDLPDYEDVEPSPPPAPPAITKTPRELAREDSELRFYMTSRLPESPAAPRPSRQLPTPPSGARDFVRGLAAKKSRTVDGQTTTALVLSDSDDSLPRASSSKTPHSPISTLNRPPSRPPSSSPSKPGQGTQKQAQKQRKRRKSSSSASDSGVTWIPFKRTVATTTSVVAKVERESGKGKGKHREGQPNKILGAEKAEVEAKHSDVRPSATVNSPSCSHSKPKENRTEGASEKKTSTEVAKPSGEDLKQGEGKEIEAEEPTAEGSRQSRRLQERKRISKKQKEDKLAKRSQRQNEKKLEKAARREGKIRELDRFEDLWERPPVAKQTVTSSRPIQDFLVDLHLLRLSSTDCDPQKRMAEHLSISASLILEDKSSSTVSNLGKSRPVATMFNCTYDNSRDPKGHPPSRFGFIPRSPIDLRLLLDSTKELPTDNFNLVLSVTGQQGDSVFLETKTVLIEDANYVRALTDGLSTIEFSVSDPSSSSRCELLLRRHERDHATSELEKVQMGLDRITLREKEDDLLPVGMSKRELREVMTPEYVTPSLKSGRCVVDFEHRRVIPVDTLTASEARPTPHSIRPLLREAYQLIDAKLELSPSQQDLLKMQRGYTQPHPLIPSSKRREMACWTLRAKQGVFRDAEMEKALLQHLVVLMKVKVLDEDGVHEIMQSVREETKLVLARDKQA